MDEQASGTEHSLFPENAYFNSYSHGQSYRSERLRRAGQRSVESPKPLFFFWAMEDLPPFHPQLPVNSIEPTLLIPKELLVCRKPFSLGLRVSAHSALSSFNSHVQSSPAGNWLYNNHNVSLSTRQSGASSFPI